MWASISKKIRAMGSAFWIAIGFVFVAAAMVGLVLPIIPTVPFLIVAAFAFSKGSKRLEQWILNHRHFGPPVRDWRYCGAIATHYKLIAIAMMATSLAFGWYLALPPLALWGQAGILFACAIFVATRPGRKSASSHNKSEV